MQLAVIGTGYVGLVAGTCFAQTGHDVVCVDSDAAKIERLRRGDIPIYEPGLAEMVAHNLKEGRLAFTTEPVEAVELARVIFLAVGTPQCPDGSADLSHLFAAVRDIGRLMRSYKIIVTKSTVPVGTGARIAELLRQSTDVNFDVASNPEFLKEGAAIDDFMKPDRVVIGADDVGVAETMQDLYAPFVRTGKPILVMDVKSAELTKYACNAMLAARISFVNELAMLCEALGANISEVRQGMATDARIGPHFLFPGPGYGGSCFPKDVAALLQTARSAGRPLEVVAAVQRANERQKRVLLEKVVQRFGEDLSGRTIAVWGLAFKPKTDDMRESPAIPLIEGLLERGAAVVAHDPEAMHTAAGIFGERVRFAANNYAAAEGADALVLVTEWTQFRRPNFERLREIMKSSVIFDGRNIYNGAALSKLGLEHHGIGLSSRP